MFEQLYTESRIADFRREAAAFSLAASVPKAPKIVRERAVLSAEQVELRLAAAHSSGLLSL